MNNHRKKHVWRVVTAILMAFSIIVCNEFSYSNRVYAKVGQETTGMQNMMTDKLDTGGSPEEYKMSEQERKAAIAYLAGISLAKGEDPSGLSAEEIEDIEYLNNALIKYEKLPEEPIKTTSEGDIKAGETAAIATTLIYYFKHIDNVAEKAGKLAESDAYINIVAREVKDLRIKNSNKIGKLNKQIKTKTRTYDKVVVDKGQATNPNTIKNIKSKRMPKAKGNLKIANQNKQNFLEKLTDKAEVTAREEVKGIKDKAKAENLKQGKISQTLGILMNLWVYVEDLSDLANDNMISKDKGEDEYVVMGERGAVVLDAAVAGLGVANGVAVLTGAKAVAFGFGISISAPVALGVVLVSLLAHTETGQNILKGTAEWAGEASQNIEFWWNGKKFGVDIMGEKMIDHINDRAYMEQLLIKLANKNTGRTKPANGVGALKPNIYLYPEEQTDVIVSFDHPELLTTVIPDYSGNWSVTAEPDGTLHSENGQDYSYLFYESETQPFFFGNKEGWLIKADERAERYTEILTEYGFNEKEIADFVEFWVDKLPEGVDYMMYPNDTEIIDRAMPVSFSTEPDSIFRIWFTFEVYDDQEVPEPEVEEFIRDGFTVVEWGGVILN